MFVPVPIPPLFPLCIS